MIVWFVADRMGCGVYRCLIPALGLKEQGISDSEFVDRAQCEETPLPTQVLEGATIVVVQRPGHPIFRQWFAAIRRAGVPWCVELDDDIWHLARHNPAYDYWRQAGVMETLMLGLRSADYVLVSTPPLADEVKKRTGRHPRDIVVAPNHLHPDVWGAPLLETIPRKPDPEGRVVLGWQGSPTHDMDFRVVLPALQIVLARYPHAILRFVGCVPTPVRGAIPPARFQWMKGVKFEHYPLTMRVAAFDIALAPLNESAFNLAKSPIRWLESGALRVPCVASAVGPYRHIDHGRTGFVARTTAEWVAGLSTLIEHHEVREALAEQAHHEVWRTWGPSCVQAWVPVVQGAGKGAVV
jgi:glycosyltransferase involved in cell wall biosynthesis